MTILFTDLVGSTTLRAQLGEERAEVARREHHRLLGEAIAAHQGTLHDDLGDGIMASFAGAADAVAAAVAIQQAATSGGGRRDDEAVASIRVGISAGDVAWEQGHPHGMPLVEAARLCGVAEGGQILVAEIVRVLARGRGGHTFTPVGQITLKGLPEPVAACAVAWEPLGPAAGIPLPARLGTRAAFAMFGRSGEEEILTRAWEKARDGERQLVLIAGEPGIGKTRLAVEAARAAHGEGATVLLGACDEDVGLPYRPFVEALRHFVAHAAERTLAAHVRTHRGELARLVPELTRRVANVPSPQVAEAETERFLLFEAVTGLLAAASHESPVVLVLDDLQWAAAPELLLLKHLLRSAEPMRLLVIATYRDTDLSRTHPLTAVLADLRRESGIERVALDGLDETAVEALVTAVARHDLDPALIALARAIQRETEGNPFFIGEVIRHLSESGALVHANGQWTYRGETTDLGIPAGVRDVVGRRLARLSERTRRLLGLAAVIGRQFDVALLVELAEATEDAVLDALDEATAAALVSELRGSPGQFAFRHALIRSTLYEEQSATRRVGLHRHVGEALEALVQATPGARVEELAYHWLAASRTDSVAKAIGYARQAGERALANLAFEEAAAHFARALGVLEPRDPDGERLRCDLLLAMVDAERRAGDARYRETVAKAAAVARALGDGERLALAALASARAGGFMASTSLVDEGLIALYDEAAGALGDADSLLRARLLGQLAVELVYAPQRERRDALTAEAVAIARRLGDRTGLAQVLGLRLLAMNDPFTLAERLALTGELTALAGALGSTELAWHAAVHRTGALLESGDIGGAEGALVEGERRAGELRQPVATWWARTGRTMLAVMRGAPDAEAQVFATFELGTAGGQPDAATVFGGQLNTLRNNQGRAGELADVIRAGVDTMPHLSPWRAAFARLYTETDQLEQAREQVDILRASGIDPPLDWSWPGYMATLSEAVRDLDDRAAAAVLYERLRPVARQVYVLAGMITCGGSYGLYAGMLAACLQRWDDAERHFADALAMNERLGARPYVVRTRRAWAAMLLDRGEPGDAHHAAELIAAGLGEAERLGMAREVVRFARVSDRVPPIAFEAALHALEGGASSEVPRCELLLALAGRLDGAGDHDAARALFDAAADIARRHPEPVLLARAALGTPTPCADRVEEALAVLGDRNDRLRARLLAALADALHASSEPARGVALSEQALTLARRVSEPRTLLRALTSRYVVLADAAHAEARVDVAREIVSLAESIHDGESAARSREWLAQATADLEAARALEPRTVAASSAIREVASAPEPETAISARPAARAGVFRRDGAIWTIRLDETSCRLRDLLGLRYLEYLLRHAGEDLHVLDLVATVTGSDGRLASSSDAGPVLDAAAKAAYRRRLEDLRAEFDEAERFADIGRRARAQAEIDALTAELSAAVGLGGRDRVTGATTERARSTVTHAIRAAIRRVHKDLPTLGDELDLRVRTGIYCLYVPDSVRPISWSF